MSNTKAPVAVPGAVKPGATRVRSRARHLLTLRPRAVWRFLNDSKAPVFPKLLLVGSLAYLVFPLDLIPEIPFGLVGLIDDLGVLSIALAWLGTQVARYEERELERVEAVEAVVPALKP